MTVQSMKELVVERAPAPQGFQENSGVPIKSILLVVHEDDALEARLEAALSLARACSAHLQLLHVVPLEAYTYADAFGGMFVSGEIVRTLEKGAAKLRASLERRLKKEDVNWSYEVASAATLPELLKHAAFADMIFIGRQPRWHEFGRTGPGLLGALVCSSRTPLCVPGDQGATFDPFGKAVIAWKGSIEAANAVRASIGLLRMASAVRVIRYDEDDETGFPDTSLLEYLSRHGIQAEMETHSPKVEIGYDLINFATRERAEYIVMGAYSHTRAGEFLFGGVTRELLRNCPISLVMSH